MPFLQANQKYLDHRDQVLYLEYLIHAGKPGADGSPAVQGDAGPDGGYDGWRDDTDDEFLLSPTAVAEVPDDGAWGGGGKKHKKKTRRKRATGNKKGKANKKQKQKKNTKRKNLKKQKKNTKRKNLKKMRKTRRRANKSR